MLRKLPPFEYYQPATLEEALGLLADGDGVYPLAGGTDLLGAMKERGLNPRAVVNIKAIPGLSGIELDGEGGLRLGGATSTRSIARSPVVQQRFAVLAQATRILGSMQIGNRATVGGNLCNASPAADSAPPLLVLDASVRLVGVKGERWLPLREFFLGPGKTAKERELLAEVYVPPASPRGRGVFYKLGPRGTPEDICIVSVAAFGVPDEAEECWEDVRIALGAVAPTPIRASHAEAALRGQPMSAGVHQEAARLAAEEDARPITDIRGSADYRQAMVEVLLHRALEVLAGRGQGG